MTALFGFVVGVLCAPWVYIGVCSLILRAMRRRGRSRVRGRREYELADPIWNAAIHIAADEGARQLRAERDAA